MATGGSGNINCSDLESYAGLPRGFTASYKRKAEETIQSVDVLKIVLPKGWRMKCAECMDAADFAGSFSGIKQYGYN